MEDMFGIINHQLIVIWQDIIMPKYVNEMELTIYIKATRNVPNKWKTILLGKWWKLIINGKKMYGVAGVLAICVWGDRSQCYLGMGWQGS